MRDRLSVDAMLQYQTPGLRCCLPVAGGFERVKRQVLQYIYADLMNFTREAWIEMASDSFEVV